MLNQARFIIDQGLSLSLRLDSLCWLNPGGRNTHPHPQADFYSVTFDSSLAWIRSQLVGGTRIPWKICHANLISSVGFISWLGLGGLRVSWLLALSITSLHGIPVFMPVRSFHIRIVASFLFRPFCFVWLLTNRKKYNIKSFSTLVKRIVFMIDLISYSLKKFIAENKNKTYARHICIKRLFLFVRGRFFHNEIQ